MKHLQTQTGQGWANYRGIRCGHKGEDVPQDADPFVPVVAAVLSTIDDVPFSFNRGDEEPLNIAFVVPADFVGSHVAIVADADKFTPREVVAQFRRIYQRLIQGRPTSSSAPVALTFLASNFALPADPKPTIQVSDTAVTLRYDSSSLSRQDARTLVDLVISRLPAPNPRPGRMWANT